MVSDTWDGVERRVTRDELHMEHHEFIKALIEKERRKQELWEKIKENVGSWALICVLGFIAWSAMDSFIHYLKTKP